MSPLFLRSLEVTTENEGKYSIYIIMEVGLSKQKVLFKLLIFSSHLCIVLM